MDWVGRVGIALALACGPDAGGGGSAEGSGDGSSGGPDPQTTSGPQTDTASDASASGEGSGSGEGSDGSSGDGSSGEHYDSLQECIEAAGIALDCSGDETGSEWVAFAPDVTCTGRTGGSKDVATFYFADFAENSPLITRLTLTRQPMSATDELFELTPAAPVRYDDIPLELDWSAFLKPMTFAGGLTFVDATVTTAATSLDALPDVTALGIDATLSGTFELHGATLSVLDTDGEIVTVESPGFEVVGCFNLRADIDVEN